MEHVKDLDIAERSLSPRWQRKRPLTYVINARDSDTWKDVTSRHRLFRSPVGAGVNIPYQPKCWELSVAIHYVELRVRRVPRFS